MNSVVNSFSWWLSVYEAGGSGRGTKEMPPPLPLKSCDSWMVVKEKPDRKKNVLNWQGSQYSSVTQRFGYPRICLDRVLNIS